MSHSYVSNLMHCTFSTKDRYSFIDSDLESRLWPYLGGIARENRMKALAIGGTTDHLHALRVLSLSRPLRGLTHHYNRGSHRFIAGISWCNLCESATADD